MGEIKLNPQQQDAVDSIEGALLLLAGAGTGKTRVIVQRIGHMLDSGISSRSILAVTFTNKAAREMRERVAALNGITPDETPLVTTFHSFCNEVLRTHTALAGFKRGFTIATDGYQKGLLRAICSELQLDGNGIDPYTWLAHISLAKANMQGPDEMSRMTFPDAPRVAAIYRRYQERMKRMNLMDFDDLLLYTLQLWETRTDCLAAYRARFKYIMIDEYQDTNRVQLKLMALLAGTDANICAVGDDDQSIYGWRGASQENILSFEEYFPDARVIRLEQNYRSSNMILKAANALISHNPTRREKNLWSERGEGERLRGVRCGDEHAEAEYVSNAIYNMSMRGTSLSSRGRDWRRYAVLYRTGAQSRVLEESLRRRRIPFVVMGSRTFYQRKEILDVLTMLELSLNPANDMAVQRVINVPPRGIGDSLLDRITEQARAGGRSLFAVLCDNDFLGTLPGETAAQLKTFTEAIQRCGRSAESVGAIYPVVNQLLTDIGYEASLIQMYRPRENALERRDNVREFLTGILEYDSEANGKGSLEAYLEMIALQDAGDRREKDKDVTENAVNLMTIHASKGLEFPVVFIVGLEQGLFPHQRALDEGGIEEERRLCYVAITRARERVIMTYADKRRILNRVCVKRLSTFLNEIPEEYIEFSSTDDEKMKEASAVNALDYIAQIKARLGNDHQNH